MKKQLQLITPVLFMVLACLTGYGQNVNDQFDINGYAYKITSLTPPRVGVVNYTGSATEVTIPSTVDHGPNNYTVTSIAPWAFQGNNLTSVTIPGSVTSIGNWAFQGNNLTSVTIPNSVTSIGQGAFRDNNLTGVEIPNSVTSIGAQAFASNQLTEVTIPGSVTSIGVDAFGGNQLTEVTIPGSVTSIGNWAFQDNNLTSVTIPNSVTSIGDHAFSDNNLTEVTIPGSVTSIAPWAFQGNNLTSVTIPNSVTSIGVAAFGGNQLTSVKIPNSVTSIGAQAFAINPLVLVTVEAIDPPSIEGNTFGFGNHRSQVDVVVPKDKRQDYLDNGWTGFRSLTEILGIGDQFTYADLRCEITLTSISTGYVGIINNFIKIVDYTGPGGELEISALEVSTPYDERYKIESIGDGAFRDKRLTRVTMPYGFRIIGKHAFRDNELASVEIPSIVEWIGDFAFANNELEEVIMHKNGHLEDIQRNAFRDNRLTHVDIPDRVTYIGTWAFVNNQLDSITLGANVEQIGYGTFQGNNLTSVTIPGKVWEIGTLAFANNPIKTVVAQGIATVPTIDNTFSNRHEIDVVIPKGASISAYEAAGWTGFKSITEALEINDTFIVDHITYRVTSIDLDKEVTVIGYNTAGGSSVTIPSTVDHGPNTYTVTVIGNEAFKEKGLTRVTIPNTVTYIGGFAFANNELEELIMHKNGHLEDIQRNAFRDNKLTSVDIPDRVTHIGTWAFVNNQLDSITLGANVEQIGYGTFQGNNLTSVTIPGNVWQIRTLAFHNNPITTVTAQGVATVPTITTDDTFQNRHEIDVVVPRGARGNYQNNTGWTGFKSITEVAELNDTFIVDHITYQITSIDPDEVAAINYNTAGGTHVTIPSTADFGPNAYRVTRIGNNAFREKRLIEVTIPGSVTSIESHAFSDNDLTEVTIPNGVTSIGNSTFRNNELARVTISGELTSIGISAFRDNDLTRVTIPGGVASIGSNAFSSNGLTKVTVEATSPPSLADANAFTDRHLVDLVVPFGAQETYNQSTSDWTGFKSTTGIPEVGVSFTVDHITYEITDIAPITVTAIDYTGPGGEVTIPSTVDHGLNTYTVTSIGLNAFRNSQLTSVIIPNTVTSIGNSAFRENSLAEVTIPNSVTRIGGWAFANTQLTGVTISNSITIIEDFTFLSNNLTEVIIPEGVTSIGSHAFQSNQLASVEISNTVSTINQSAFRFNQLTEVTIPGSVTRIGINVFNGNPDLRSVKMLAVDPPTLHEGTFLNANRSQIDVVVPGSTLDDYQNNTGWTGFRSITEVAEVNGTFTADHITYQITSIDPDEVVAINYNTAGGTHVTIPSTADFGPNAYRVTRIGNNAFMEKRLIEVTIPGSVTSIESHAFRDNDLTEVTIPGSVTSIGISAFRDNDLTRVTIPGGLTSIGNNAFLNNELTEIVFSTSSSLTSIGRSVFKTNKLTSVDIPDGVTSIGNGAFSQNELTEVTIPGSVTSIDPWAFDGMSLGKVFVNAIDPPSIEGNTFGDRSQIDVVVPSGSLGSYHNNTHWEGFNSITEPAEINDIFITENITYRITSINPNKEVTATDYDIAGGTIVTIPSTVDHGPNTYTVTAIGQWAFHDKQLTDVTLPDGVTSIGNSAFHDNELTSVIIPNTVTSIGSSAFQINELTHVVIPDGVTRIKSYAFADNNLTRVEIPDGLTDIEVYAFWNRPNSLNLAMLVTVGADEPPALTVHSFSNRSQIDVVVPKGDPAGSIKAIYENENAWGTDFKSISEVLELNDTFIANHITYKITSLIPLEVTATSYNNAGGTSVTIPQAVQYQGTDYQVTAIGNHAFSNNQLTELIIPNSVTAIGLWAFNDNQLTEVTLPDGVTRIGAHAFSSNQLTELIIPNSVTAIGEWAFWGNPNLATVEAKPTDPPLLNTLVHAFGGHRTQVDLVVPRGRKQAYEAAGWTDFKSITEVAEINDIFTVDHMTYRVTSIAPNPNTVAATDYNTVGGSSVTIPSTVGHGPNNYTVTAIGAGAFQNSDLIEVNIPDVVTGIDSDAFSDNPNLAMVKMARNVPPTLHEAAFQNPGRSLIHLTVPAGTRDDYLAANRWGSFRSVTYDSFTDKDIEYGITSTSPAEVEIMDYIGTAAAVEVFGTINHNGETYTVTAIGNRAFTEKGLTSIEIPTSVTGIGLGAFRENQLGSVTIPDGVTIIGGHAFKNNNLTRVTIPGSVISIGQYAFQGNELAEVSFSRSSQLTRIEEGVFKTNQLTRVTIPNGVDSIGISAFSQNELTQVILPGSVANIDAWAFDGMSLGTVFVQATAPPSLAENAFGNRSQIDVVVPSSAVDAYNESTNGWTNFKSISSFIGLRFTMDDIEYKITSTIEVEVVNYTVTGGTVTIPSTVEHGLNTYTVTSIGNDAFRGNQLTEVTFADQSNVTRIGVSAFMDNQLTSVTIPNGVTSIGQQAFLENQLTKVTFAPQSKVTSIGSHAFGNNQLTSVTIPNGVTSIGQDAFKDNPHLVTVVSRGTTPPSIEANTFTNADRSQIALFVPKVSPAGSIKTAYRDAEWTGFSSITEGVGVSIEAPSEKDNLSAFTVTFRFDLDVTDFVQEDIAGNAVNATVVDGSFSQVNGSTYTVEITPTACEGTITIGIPENVAEYGPNFPNLAASATVTVNAIPSAPLVSSPLEYCVDQTADALTATGDNLLWYTTEAGETGTPEAPIPNTENAGETFYYVSQTNENGCESDRAEIVVTVVGACPARIGALFTVSDIDYEITSTSPYTVAVTGRSRSSSTPSPGAIAIPGTVTYESITYTVTAIGANAFNDNQDLDLVTVEATAPPSLHENGLTGRGQIDLVVPADTRKDYLKEGWTGFRSITFGIFTDDDIKYGITAVTPNEVKVIDYTGSATAVEIPETVEDHGETYTVTAIGANAFNDNPDLDLVTVEATDPPSLHENALTGRGQIDLVVPAGAREDYLKEGWTGFRSITFGIFTDNDIKYGIIAVTPNEVMVMDYIGSATAVEIPETVEDHGETYTVIAIGANAFNDNQDLASVTVEATDPPSLHENALTGRGQISLIVPGGTRDDYFKEGWDGFVSITEEQVVTSIRNHEFRDFTLYPNPARDKVYVDIDPRSGQELEQVNIYTMTGAYLYSENEREINTGRLSEGMYLFEIVTQTGNRSMKKVIIQ